MQNSENYNENKDIYYLLENKIHFDYNEYHIKIPDYPFKDMYYKNICTMKICYLTDENQYSNNINYNENDIIKETSDNENGDKTNKSSNKSDNKKPNKKNNENSYNNNNDNIKLISKNQLNKENLNK